jgi:hypothetical protein
MVGFSTVPAHSFPNTATILSLNSSDDDDGQYFVREEIMARSRPTTYHSPITYCLSFAA